MADNVTEVSIELSEIIAERNSIRNKLMELGLANAVDKLDVLAAAIATIVNQGAVSITVREGETATIPAGYHNGAGTIAGVGGGGNYTLQSKTVTPTKNQQAITSDAGYYGLSDVTVKPIPDAYQDVSAVTATAADVLTGKILVLADGTVVAGTMANNGAISKVLDVTTVEYAIPKGYHSGTGKVKIAVETARATPTKSQQIIQPTSGGVLGQVTVEPIPDAYQDVSKVTVTAADILIGKIAVDAAGNVINGAIPSQMATFSINPLTETQMEIPAGHYQEGSTIQITEDLLNALKEI